MTLRLYMDQHVHAAITAGLLARGVDCVTVFQDGNAESDDDVLFSRTSELGRVVFTQDEDFLQLASDRLRLGIDFNGLIYAHQLGVTIGDAIRDLELIAKVLEPGEMINHIEWLPLR